jgi:predicted SAM-dependent methyltransferase
VANHFLEHTQDPIATLKNFCRVVRPGGLIYLAVPNRLATFDQDREVTTIAHLVEDHQNGPEQSRHHHFREWVTLVEPHFGRKYETEEAINARVNQLLDKDYSIHFHCWRPSDFDQFLTFCEVEQGVGFRTAMFCQAPEEMVVILKVK